MSSNLVRPVQNEQRRVEKFGITDKFGRAIGVKITTYEGDYVEAEYGYNIEPGHYFIVCINTSRNDESYGSARWRKPCKTIEERDAFIEKTIAANRKAMTKKYGRVA